MNKRLKKENAFTLAEMLITMLVIAVLAIVTVPLVKKTKFIMDEGNTKNSWVAMWEEDQLVVYDNGKRKIYEAGSPYFFDAKTAKFTPPQGVENVNVMVVGGGGGGAAGVSLPGFSKKYFADNNSEEYSFVAPNDGLYRIIAIGGGGGGAGGSLWCSGESGKSGGAAIVTADLKKNDQLAVVVGQGGTKGEDKDFGDQLGALAAPITKIVLTAAACYLCPALAPALIKSCGISVLSTVAGEITPIGGALGSVIGTIGSVASGNVLGAVSGAAGTASSVTGSINAPSNSSYDWSNFGKKQYTSESTGNYVNGEWTYQTGSNATGNLNDSLVGWNGDSFDAGTMDEVYIIAQKGGSGLNSNLTGWNGDSFDGGTMDEVVVTAKRTEVKVDKGSLEANLGKINGDTSKIEAAMIKNSGLVTLGIDVISNIIGGILSPSRDWKRGGGHGLNTVIYGGGNVFGDGSGSKVEIIAGGGAGGRYVDKKIGFFSWKCKANGRNAASDNSDKTTIRGISIDKTYSIQSNADDRWFCVNGDTGKLLGGNRETFCSRLNSTISGGLSEATTFGDGGWRGGSSRDGRRGSDGYAEITEVNAYGGGGGQAGSVSVHTFAKLPPISLPVVVGKGGNGGQVADAAGSVTVGKQKGQDGGYSSFGSQVIAGGGEGGQLKVVDAQQSGDLYKSKGQDGLVSALDKNAKKRLPSGLTALFRGGYDKVGEGESSSLKGYPGLGGAGGSAYAQIISNVNKAYSGGNGSPGMVLVTW